jgi:hypothetical protein
MSCRASLKTCSDVVGRSYDGVDYVVLHDVHETMLDASKSDRALAAGGVISQTPCNESLLEPGWLRSISLWQCS